MQIMRGTFQAIRASIEIMRLSFNANTFIFICPLPGDDTKLKIVGGGAVEEGVKLAKDAARVFDTTEQASS